jgi:hypothetical protein
VAALRSFPEPVTVEQLQAFLGLFNFYHHFVPAAASILKPLTDSLQGSPKGKQQLNWSAAMKKAFAAARFALADTALLDHPSEHAELSLVSDTSASHVGAVLQQQRGGGGAAMAAGGIFLPQANNS